jgi:hypothetical protein
MQIRIERVNPHSGRIKIVRVQTPGVRTWHFKPIVREPVPATRAASERLHPSHIAPLSRAAEDRSPAARARRATRRLIPSPNEDDSSQFQSTGDVIQHGKRGGLLCRHRWRSDLITMPLA